jgi:hypothetical protein
LKEICLETGKELIWKIEFIREEGIEQTSEIPEYIRIARIPHQ